MDPKVIMEGIGLRSFGTFTIEGEALVTADPITFLGFFDHNNGKITEEKHPLYGHSITGKIFVFPRGLGSTVGSYVLLNLRDHKTTPIAILNQDSDQGTVAGCSVARIPLAYKINIVNIHNGDWVKIELTEGKATISVWDKDPKK